MHSKLRKFFVRPEHRRAGHGRWLADQVVKLADEKKMPLRLWVAFTDSKSEQEANQPAVIAIARRLGVQFQSCTVPWAAYFATNEMPGSEIPIEPAIIPSRPRTPKNELLATVMALGLAGSMPSDDSKMTSDSIERRGSTNRCAWNSEVGGVDGTTGGAYTQKKPTRFDGSRARRVRSPSGVEPSDNRSSVSPARIHQGGACHPREEARAAEG